MAASTSRCSAPPTMKSSRSKTAARTRAGRCRRASCTAGGWPARCTAGTSNWIPAVRWRRIGAVRASSRPGSRAAGCGSTCPRSTSPRLDAEPSHHENDSARRPALPRLEQTMTRDFWKSGHTPTLLSAFLYFDIAFMVWVMLGPLGVQIAQTLELTAAQKGMMVATPVLAGALLRIVMGVLVDHLRPKMAGLIGQLVVMGGLAWAWLAGIHSYRELLVLGVLLGFAGAAFAVALPLASRWYPPQHQGTALGIAGAGNSGTVFAALFAPGLAAAFGWGTVFGIALIPVGVAFLVYLVFARDAPDCPPPKSLHQYMAVLKDRDAWWFMFFYFVTFGGFVGLASSLTIYFNDEYGMAPVQAGYFTAACVFVGSLVRPMGGMLADRIGGIRTLLTVYGLAGVFLIIVSFGAPNA